MRRRRWAFLVLVGAAACGTLESTSEPGDAGADGGTTPPPPPDGSVVDGTGTDAPPADAGSDGRCSPTAAFGTPALLGQVASFYATQDSPRLSEDELTLVFHADTGSGQSYLRVAARDDAAAGFDTSTALLPEVAATSDLTPFLADAGKTLYLSTTRFGTGPQLGLTTRLTTGTGFASTPTKVFPADNVDRRFPYVVGTRIYYAEITGPVGGQHSAIWAAQLDGGDAGPLPAPINVDNFEYTPVVSADGHTIYFTSYRDGGRLEAYGAVLFDDGGVGVPFALPELGGDGGGDVHLGWISPDDCRMYFARAASADQNLSLYVAARNPD
jgi:hypothetical protein